MSKGHRDNHKARKKRGDAAFEKKAKRRAIKVIVCNLCGVQSRPKAVVGGLCPMCRLARGLATLSMETGTGSISLTIRDIPGGRGDE